MPGVDIATHISWSQDEDYYYASVEVRATDGQVGVIEVKVDRDWVIRAAQMLKRRLMTTAPAGVDVGAWHNPSDPERFVKLCQFVAGREVKRQLTDQVQRDGIVIAPWFGEWTTATADAAYRMILAAQNDDEASIQQLERIRECAEAGDPAAAKALGMINSVAKLVARGLPEPSVIATRMPMQAGAIPMRKPPKITRRALPPRRVAPPSKSTPASRAAAAKRGGTPSRGAVPTGKRAAGQASAAIKSLSSRSASGTPMAPATQAAILRAPMSAALGPLVLAPTAPAVVAPVVPMYPGYPYGYPQMSPSGGGGGGGGAPEYFPDEGEDLDDNEDEGNGLDMLDDDGTYYEEPLPTDDMFPDDGPSYAVGDYPEEMAQSKEDEDDGPPPEDDGGPMPGEGGTG